MFGKVKLSFALTVSIIYVVIAVAGLSLQGQQIVTQKGDAPGRIEVSRVPENLNLGESNEVPLDLHGSKVAYGDVRISRYTDQGQLMSPDSDDEASLTYGNGGQAFLRIVPEMAGKVHVRISLIFTDGMFDKAEFDSDVIAGPNKPDEFYLVRAGNDPRRRDRRMRFDLTGTWSKGRVSAMAIYEDGIGPVIIPNREVKFSIKALPGTSLPIKLDESTGDITALADGYALVVAQFRGMNAGLCVEVLSDSSDRSNRANCSDLDPHGTLLPKEQHDAPLVKAYPHPM